MLLARMHGCCVALPSPCRMDFTTPPLLFYGRYGGGWQTGGCRSVGGLMTLSLVY